MYFDCMYGCVPHMCLVPGEAGKRYQIPMWMLGTEPVFSARTASIHNY